MVTKLGRVVMYHKEVPLIKLHDPSITLFLSSRDKLNTVCLNLHWIHIHLHIIDSRNPLNMWLHEVKRRICLYYHSAYGHNMYKSGDILQTAPNHKFA